MGTEIQAYEVIEFTNRQMAGYGCKQAGDQSGQYVRLEDYQKLLDAWPNPGMEADVYQSLAKRTLVDAPEFKVSDRDFMLMWNALGLAGEAGEVADLIKKGVCHQHGVNIDKIKKELGDLAWYLAAMCSTLNLDLSQVLQENVEKLQKRYPNGYNTQDSIKRVDVG